MSDKNTVHKNAVSRTDAHPSERRSLLSRGGMLLALAVLSPRTALAHLTQTAPAQAVPTGRAWGDSLALDVSFTIRPPAAAGGRYNRPYSAVWIEDEDGNAVRTLSLWVNSRTGLKYVSELRRWSRDDSARRAKGGADLVATLSGPTRPPGSYAVSWDGKNDRGQPVPAGNYTLYIEVVREDGPYQRVHEPLTIGAAPFTRRWDGEGEIADVVAELRPRR